MSERRANPRPIRIGSSTQRFGIVLEILFLAVVVGIIYGCAQIVVSVAKLMTVTP